MEFSKETFERVIEELNLKDKISFEDIPAIDLYMDQVITLFENNLERTKRNEKDKILTKTMINNYAKDKLLMSIKNKKYSREHIVLMVLIYNLKQSLAISDIKTLLTPMVSNLEGEENKIDIKNFYNTFLSINEKDLVDFEGFVDNKMNSIEDIFKGELKDIENPEYIKLLLMIVSLINTSNMQRRLAEKLIDEYLTKEI